MGHDFPLPFVLAIGTLLIVVGFALYHLRSHYGSQTKRGEHPGGIAGPE